MSYGPTLGLPSGLGSSATPRARTFLPDDSTLKAHAPRGFQTLQPQYTSKSQVAQSYAGRSFVPGTFNSALRPGTRAGDEHIRPPLRSAYRSEYKSQDDDPEELKLLKQQLNKQERLREGSENLLDALNPKTQKERRAQAVKEAQIATQEIAQIKARIDSLSEHRGHGIQRPRPKQLDLTPSTYRPYSYVASSAEPTPMPPLTEVQAPTVILSDILQEMENQGMQPDYYISRANQLVDLFTTHQTLRYDLVWSVFGQRLQMLMMSESSEIVAAAFRIARHAVTDRASLKILRRLRTDDLVVISLLKDQKAAVEREQALKFVRAFLEVPSGIAELSEFVTRTIISIAEHADDKMYGLAVETLAELLLRDPKTLIQAGGLGALLTAYSSGKYAASEGILTVFLYLLDCPETRQYLPPGIVIEMVMSGLIDPRVDEGDEGILHAQAKLVSSILKSWPALFCLGMYNFRSVRSIVNALICPAPITQDILLDLIFDVLRIQSPSWSSEFLAGRRLTVTTRRAANLRRKISVKHALIAKDADPLSEDMNLVEHYRTLLLVVFLHCNLVPTLVQVIEEDNSPPMRRKSMLLLGEVLKLASRRLPTKAYETMFMLPALFNIASAFGNPNRLDSTNAMYQIESVNRTLLRSGSTMREPLSSMLLQTCKPGDPNYSTRKIQDVLNITEESELKDAIERTGITNHTKWEKWNWTIIAQLIDGPLTEGKRVEEAAKIDRFFRRLIGFYRPFKFRFSELEERVRHQQYVTTGCALVRTLLQTPQGLQVLGELELFNQIGECLAQMDPFSGITAENGGIFSRERLKHTLSYGYIQMVGVLSSDQRGLEIMAKWQMNSTLFYILELEDRDDLIVLILESLDFTLPGHPQILLTKALTTCSKEVRVFATGLLARFCITNLPDILFQGETLILARRSIRQLIDQLYDPDIEVCELAVKILDNACNKTACLEYVVYCRPSLEHLGEIGEPLLLRFLSTSAGYQYLVDLNYIEQQMDGWLLGGNDNYVHTVEASLARSLHGRVKPLGDPQADDEDEALNWTNPAQLPTHFYRELAQTIEGCELLEDKGHFDRFVLTIREHGQEKTDPETLLKVKGCLWAIGNIGSMPLGSQFLEGSDVVGNILKIATASEVLTMRGTAFYVLGLISRSLHGMEMLSEVGWDSAATVLGRSRGYVIPGHLGSLFSLRPWPRYTDTISSATPAPDITATERAAAAGLDTGYVRKLIRGICELGNSVLSKRAAGEIGAICVKRPELFKSRVLYGLVMGLMGTMNCRLQARRFVGGLWDAEFVKGCLLEGENGEEGEESRPRALTT